MNDQEVVVPAKARFKSKIPPIYRVGFYGVHLVLICAASLPSVFFIYHHYQPDHIKETRKPPNHATERSNVFSIDINGVHSSTNDSHTMQSNDTKVVDVPCHAPLVYNNLTNECFAPCEWTTISTRTHRLYYVLMAVGLWLPLFAAIFIIITWLKIQSLRQFPHVVRFYIILCCILLACCKMIPLRIGLKKVFCKETERWDPSGMKSLMITMQGASCHYLTLCLTFWSTCFIANTYLVVVRGTRVLFKSSFIIHLVQSLLCWIGPAVIVGICISVKYPSPSYKIVFIDFMTAGPCGEVLKYLAVTLPLEIMLGISMCLLWSITWCIRRSRLDNTRQAIRADKDTQSMVRIERQFTSMKVIMLLVVGVMLSVTTIKDYQLHKLVNMVKQYFHCLKFTDKCQQPNLLTPLYAVMIVSPGFLCMVFFFLLFMNKDCREIWASCFKTLCRLGNLTKPRSDTTKSRCSSNLTVLADRRWSDFLLRKDRVTQFKSSSTPDIVGVLKDKPSPTELIRKTHLSTLTLENRQRSSSTPVRLTIGHDESELARITSIPQALIKTRSPTPPHFNIEINIIGEGDCVTENQKRNNVDCVTNNCNQLNNHTESSVKSKTCFSQNDVSKQIQGCISGCNASESHLRNSPCHVENGAVVCGAGQIIDNPKNHTTRL